MPNQSVSFSIIMPCYNSSAYVAAAVESLLMQTYPNWELVAVNDGSKDDTLEILNRFAEKDERIKVYSKPNGGYVSAVNCGLEHVSGDYFLTMGSDDRLAETLFEELVNRLPEDKPLPDVIAFRALRFKDGAFLERDVLSDFDSAAELFDASASDFAEQYPQNAKILFVRDTAKCFKTSKLGNLRYFGKYGFDADGVFSTLFVRKCRSFLSLPVDGYLWTIRGDSVSAAVNPKVNLDRLRVWIKYLSAVKKDHIKVFSEQEKKYLRTPFRLCPEILGQSKKFPIKERFLSRKALRLSLKIAKKAPDGRSHYHQEFLSEPPLRKAFFWIFPCLWLKRRDYLTL